MTRALLLTAFAAAWIVAGCAEEREAPAAAARATAPEDPEVAAALAALEKSSDADREEKMEAYLSAVRQAYGNESRAYLGEAAPELDIPVPDVEPMELDAPDLLPRAPAGNAP
jgi:hypothetical protein